MALVGGCYVQKTRWLNDSLTPPDDISLFYILPYNLSITFASLSGMLTSPERPSDRAVDVCLHLDPGRQWPSFPVDEAEWRSSSP